MLSLSLLSETLLAAPLTHVPSHTCTARFAIKRVRVARRGAARTDSTGRSLACSPYTSPRCPRPLPPCSWSASRKSAGAGAFSSHGGGGQGPCRPKGVGHDLGVVMVAVGAVLVPSTEIQRSVKAHCPGGEMASVYRWSIKPPADEGRVGCSGGIVCEVWSEAPSTESSSLRAKHFPRSWGLLCS